VVHDIKNLVKNTDFFPNFIVEIAQGEEKKTISTLSEIQANQQSGFKIPADLILECYKISKKDRSIRRKTKVKCL
jgi:hypothetical protein